MCRHTCIKPYVHIRLQTFRDKQGRLRHGRTVALRRSVFDTKLNKWRLVQLGFLLTDFMQG